MRGTLRIKGTESFLKKNSFFIEETLESLFLQRLSYRQVLGLIPLVLLIHNVEEALTMPQWLVENLPLVRERIRVLRYVDFSATQIYVSLFFVSIIPFGVAFLCLRTPFQKSKVFVMLTLQGIIFWNALIPHLSGVTLLGMYNPGVITAGIVNIPFSVYLFHRSRKEGIITAEELRNILLLALVVYLPAVYLNHLLAETVASIF